MTLFGVFRSFTICPMNFSLLACSALPTTSPTPASATRMSTLHTRKVAGKSFHTYFGRLSSTNPMLQPMVCRPGIWDGSVTGGTPPNCQVKKTYFSSSRKIDNRKCVRVRCPEFGRLWPSQGSGVLGSYLPAFILLLGLGLYHYHHARTEPTLLLWATAIFSASLFLRSIDLAVCKYLPIGTHFFWHLFNCLLVYLAFRGLLTNLTTSERRID